MTASMTLNLMSGKLLLVPAAALGGIGLLLIIATAVLRRRQVHHDATAPGLYGVTGRMGGGKSYFLAWMAWTAIQRGRTVFSTFELKGCKPFPQWREDYDLGSTWVGPVLIEGSDTPGDGKGWQQIIQAPDNTMVIVDEAHGWWSSSQGMSAPIEVKMWLSTLRHRRITFFWATQWTDAVAKWLRALSFGIWECENFKAGHRYTLYHPRVINGKIGTRKSDARIYVKRTPDVMAFYDTHNVAQFSQEWGDNIGTALGSTRKDPIEHRSPF